MGGWEAGRGERERERERSLDNHERETGGRGVKPSSFTCAPKMVHAICFYADCLPRMYSLQSLLKSSYTVHNIHRHACGKTVMNRCFTSSQLV